MHGTDSFAERADLNRITNAILNFKRNQVELLSPSDRRLVDIPTTDILNWKRRRRRAMLKTLEICSRAWKREQELQLKGQKKLYEMMDWEGFQPN